MTWLSWFPESAWKGAVLLALAFLATRLLHKQPAALRHLVWTVALGGLLTMPVLSAASPVQFSLPTRVVTATPQTSPRSGESNKDKEHALDEQALAPRTVGDADSANQGTAQSSGGSVLPSWSAGQWLIAAWLLGAFILALRFAAGVAVTARLRRTAAEADEHLQNALEHSAARAGLRATPKLIVTDAVAIPCAFGWTRPTIVLPASAREWTRDRLDVVLLHEATHIRRGDYATHLVAEFARIVHWYNPLVWIASRSLRAEAERATDERVINAGATASDYAGHLLDIVRGAGALRVPAPLLPLAMRSEFEGRVIAILEYAGARRLHARTIATTLVVSVGLAGTVASIGAAPPPPAAHVTETHESTSRQQSAQSAPESASTIAALVEALSDSVPSVRLAVVTALSNARDTIVVRALIRVLREDDNAEVRRAAAHSLGQIGDALAVPALAQALDADADLEVRINAAEALGEFKGPAATDALARALGRASDPKLKVAVIEAFDGEGARRVISPLTAALRDNTPAVRVAAANALGDVEDPSIIPALIAVARDDDVEVRRAVIDALNDFNDRRLVDVFANALTDRDEEIRAAAANGLGNIEDLRTAPRQLIAALDDANAEVRHQAAHALGHIQDPASLNALVARLTDPDADVRIGVVEAISEFRDVSVTTALQKALRDSNAEVRKAAANALGERRRQ